MYKGQVTIPKKVRDRLGVHPGDYVSFKENEGAIVITKAVKKSPFDKWMGRLAKLEGQKSDDLVREMRGN